MTSAGADAGSPVFGAGEAGWLGTGSASAAGSSLGPGSHYCQADSLPVLPGADGPETIRHWEYNH